MNTKILKIASVGYIIACMGCNNNPNSGTVATDQSTKDSITQDRTHVDVDTTEISVYRHDEENLIAKNKERIAELKEKIRNDKRAIAHDYNTQLDTLNQENSRMEERLKAFRQKSKADWDTFKHDFTRDMDTVGRSITRFVQKVSL